MKITKENAKELLPIVKALAEGKMIQDKIEGLTGWVDTDEINLEYNGQKIKHRIKPEIKYRPFKSQEECRNEMHKHPDFGWVIAKDSKIMYHIYVIGIGYVLMDNMSISFPETFAEYEFTDGTPFGINKEE